MTTLGEVLYLLDEVEHYFENADSSLADIRSDMESELKGNEELLGAYVDALQDLQLNFIMAQDRMAQLKRQKGLKQSQNLHKALKTLPVKLLRDIGRHMGLGANFYASASRKDLRRAILADAQAAPDAQEPRNRFWE